MAPSSEPSYPSGLVWFRRDLRANDQAALYRALTQCQEVHCAFVFDREILGRAARDSVRKLNPGTLAKNPVILVVEAGAVLTTLPHSP